MNGMGTAKGGGRCKICMQIPRNAYVRIRVDDAIRCWLGEVGTKLQFVFVYKIHGYLIGTQELRYLPTPIDCNGYV